MSKMRSPNYPSASLETAVESARQLWAKEKRTAVPSDVAVKAMGYKSLNGPARSRLSTLRKYGLLDDASDGVRLSDLAVTILHSQPQSEDYAAAVRQAATTPELFRDLLANMADASDDALRSHLLVKKGFSDDGARQAVSALRGTMGFASLNGLQYDGGEHGAAGEMTPPAGIHPLAGRTPPPPLPRDPAAEPPEHFRVGRDSWVTVQFSAPVDQQAIKKLIKHFQDNLDLYPEKVSVQSGDGEGAES